MNAINTQYYAIPIIVYVPADDLCHDRDLAHRSLDRMSDRIIQELRDCNPEFEVLIAEDFSYPLVTVPEGHQLSARIQDLP